MNLHELSDLFISNLMATSWLEVIAVITGLLSVWYCRLENILVYPIGIISVLIYVYICYGAGLYADMGINVVYFIMSVYGWINWTRGGDKTEQLKISTLNTKRWIMNLAITGGLYIIINYLLIHFTDSTVPYIDSFTTSIFIVAMFLQAKKKVESWIFWIIGDIVSIPLYVYKGLVFTSFQFTIFLVLAIMGYIEWRRSYKQALIPE